MPDISIFQLINQSIKNIFIETGKHTNFAWDMDRVIQLDEGFMYEDNIE